MSSEVLTGGPLSFWAGGRVSEKIYIFFMDILTGLANKDGSARVTWSAVDWAGKQALGYRQAAVMKVQGYKLSLSVTMQPIYVWVV